MLGFKALTSVSLLCEIAVHLCFTHFYTLPYDKCKYITGPYKCKHFIEQQTLLEILQFKRLLKYL